MNRVRYEPAATAAKFDAPDKPAWAGLWRPLTLLAVLCVVYFAVLAWSAAALPVRLASHFDLRGNPNGWMSRDGYLWLMGVLGMALPLLMLGIAALIRVLPAETINVPHREYWLSAEHRSETTAYMSRAMNWFACFMLTYFLGLHWLVLDANRHQPVQMSNGIWVLTVAFLAVVVGWSINLIRHFSRVPAANG